MAGVRAKSLALPLGNLASRKFAAGVDEAGRGPLAGPVVAAAVILDPARPIVGVGDSKALTEKQRDALAIEIKANALAWAIAWADHTEIDSVNILQATLLAMRRALAGLRIPPDHIQVDGNRPPSIVGLGFICEVETIVKGDAKVASIGAASILAKTTRDAMMVEFDLQYPGYGLAVHKGYPTSAHFAALEKLGPCAIHRRSFAPVRASYEARMQTVTPQDIAADEFANDSALVFE